MNAVQVQEETWSVPLAPGHGPYQVCRLKRSFATLASWTVVIVDTRRFLDCWGRETKSLVVPPVRAWGAKKVRAIRDFLDPSTGVPPMPQVSFATHEKKRFFGLLRPRTIGVVSFVDGRHRVRYLESAGAERFPVEVPKECAGLLQQYCGCDVAQAVQQ